MVLGNKSRNAVVPSIQKFLMTGTRIIDVQKHDSSEKFEHMSLEGFSERTRAFVKIEDGCNRFCSYCIIPYARGRVRSKPLPEIYNELSHLRMKGFKEVVLVGINLSAYGQEFGINLADAVEAACSVEGIERVRLGSLEPERMDNYTIARLSRLPKLCPQFHLSLQSGCDATLKRMNRHYTTQIYSEIVQNLRMAFDNCSITTDIMVGFPGETQIEFEQSLAFAEKIQFAKAHIFAYSRRPGTAADKAENQIPENVKNIRCNRMIELTDKTTRKFLESQTGKVEAVLFERLKNGFFEGHTMNYTKVIVKPHNTDNLSNLICKVKITGVENGSCTGILQP